MVRFYASVLTSAYFVCSNVAQCPSWVLFFHFFALTFKFLIATYFLDEVPYLRTMDTKEKTPGTEKVESINHDSGSENADEKTGTAEDRADMFRMGKVQELRVRKLSSNALAQVRL